MDKVRRQILQSLAALGIAFPLHGIDGLRHAATATAGGDHIGDWEDTAWQYAHMLTAKPPAAVLADLMVDTLELQQVIQRNDGRAEPAWQRVAAQFGFLMAQCLGFMGEAREARHWWAVARRAADLSGDIDLRAAVRGYAAMQSLYLGHPRPVVQRQADDALAIAAGRACAGAAEAQSVRTLLAALAGDAGRATIALQDLQDMFDRMPERVTSDTETGFGWPRTRLLHNQSLVLPGRPGRRRRSRAHRGDRRLPRLAVPADRPGAPPPGRHRRTPRRHHRWRRPRRHHAADTPHRAAHDLRPEGRHRRAPRRAHQRSQTTRRREYRDLLALPPAQ